MEFLFKWLDFNFNFQNDQKTDKMHNAHIVISNTGDLVAVYRKLHLFDVETPEFRFQESRVMNGGNYLVTPLQDTPLEGGLGLLIVSYGHFSLNISISFQLLIFFLRIKNSAMICGFRKRVRCLEKMELHF